MDYRKYKLSAKEYLALAAVSAGLTACIALLFYESAWACLLFPLIGYVLYRYTLQDRRRQRMQRLAREFSDAMRALSAALQSGYSMENAWKDAEREVGCLHGKDSLIYRELEEINRTAALGVPIEKLLADFAARSGVEDIIAFAEVFVFAKRSGGDFVKMIETTTEHMRIKVETEKEIEVSVASRKLEQKVMDVVPMFILAYLRLSSGDYLDVLYKNPFGICFMSGCLCVYLFAVALSEKILSIRV